jgi:hypothetical protein
MWVVFPFDGFITVRAFHKKAVNHQVSAVSQALIKAKNISRTDAQKLTADS